MADKSKAKQLKIDYQQTFDTDNGKRVLDDIMAYCHVLEPLSGSVDTNSIIIREARRDVALTILQKLNWNDRKFIDNLEGKADK